MEGTIGEIRGFAGTFAPRGWMFCNGSPLSINQYTTLYAVIGTIYGGDGVSTFNLPDTRSRVVIGAGAGTGLPNYTLGQTAGTETHTLTVAEMPVHNHLASVQYNQNPSAATMQLMGINGQGGQPNPEGNFLGQDPGGTTSYAPASSSPLVKMDIGSAVVNSLSGPLPTIIVNGNGGSLPHPNIQPVLAANYVICVQGVFPSRD